MSQFDYFYGDEGEQFAFYRIPKLLITSPVFKRLSDGAKLLYGLMLDRMCLSVKNGWVDEHNRAYIFFTTNDVMELKVELGADVFGNIQRLDNALEALPKRLEATRENLEETERQFEMAKVESQKEFPQEAELAEKLERLAVVDALLNMDKHDREGADLGEPDEDIEAPDKSKKEMER